MITAEPHKSDVWCSTGADSAQSMPSIPNVLYKGRVLASYLAHYFSFVLRATSSGVKVNSILARDSRCPYGAGSARFDYGGYPVKTTTLMSSPQCRFHYRFGSPNHLFNIKDGRHNTNRMHQANKRGRLAFLQYRFCSVSNVLRDQS